jgi:hypothetical protein
VVDCTGLENRQPARVPGFESLSFRQQKQQIGPLLRFAKQAQGKPKTVRMQN